MKYKKLKTTEPIIGKCYNCVVDVRSDAPDGKPRYFLNDEQIYPDRPHYIQINVDEDKVVIAYKDEEK